MTIDDVVFFANHKYGECCYMVEKKDEILLFILHSKWRILTKDLYRFGYYTLAHNNFANWNTLATDNYHIQLKSRDLELLVYSAISHDLQLAADGGYKQIESNFKEFQRLWEMYLLGRELEENTAMFEWLS